ncbi:MAG: hypothetical protein KGK44_04795 [Gammaproteobacteria bacterium]|nr:hypothetical protein [Gammaproteobacteria bacterium]
MADFFTAQTQSKSYVEYSAPPGDKVPYVSPGVLALFAHSEEITDNSAFTLCTVPLQNRAGLPPNCTLKIARALALELAPISAAWLLVTLLIMAFRWVRAGFKETEA